MAFKFSLEQVLKYRMQMEQRAQIELARVEKERLREEARVQTITGMLVEQEDYLRSLDPAQANERWLADNFNKGLRADRVLAMQRAINWGKAAEAARKELAARALERKTLEKLKEKQSELYAHCELSHEQHQFDEIASLRYQIPA